MQMLLQTDCYAFPLPSFSSNTYQQDRRRIHAALYIIYTILSHHHPTHPRHWSVINSLIQLCILLLDRVPEATLNHVLKWIYSVLLGNKHSTAIHPAHSHPPANADDVWLVSTCSFSSCTVSALYCRIAGPVGLRTHGRKVGEGYEKSRAINNHLRTLLGHVEGWDGKEACKRGMRK